VNCAGSKVEIVDHHLGVFDLGVFDLGILGAGETDVHEHGRSDGEAKAAESCRYHCPNSLSIFLSIFLWP